MSEVQQPAAAPAPPPKVRSICVDTLTAIQKFEVIEGWGDGVKFTHEKWKDSGVALVLFAKRLVEMGFTLVGVMGPPGTGKSYGMKFLPTGTNMLYNIDDKELTYKGGAKEYGTRANPRYTMKIPKTYNEMLEHIGVIASRDMFAERPIAFMIGHTESYRVTNDKGAEVWHQRLKTMGNIAKASLEDMLTMCYYSEISSVGGKPKYQLRTQNTGFNTGRTMEGQHDTLLIDNNYKTIIDSIDNYYL